MKSYSDFIFNWKLSEFIIVLTSELSHKFGKSIKVFQRCFLSYSVCFWRGCLTSISDVSPIKGFMWNSNTFSLLLLLLPFQHFPSPLSHRLKSSILIFSLIWCFTFTWHFELSFHFSYPIKEWSGKLATATKPSNTHTHTSLEFIFFLLMITEWLCDITWNYRADNR